MYTNSFTETWCQLLLTVGKFCEQHVECIIIVDEKVRWEKKLVISKEETRYVTAEAEELEALTAVPVGDGPKKEREKDENGNEIKTAYEIKMERIDRE